MTYEYIQISEANDIGIITLNRPEKYNALHGPLISELLSALITFANKDIRVLIINGNGDHFCAGGDIGWMQKMGESDFRENVKDAEALAQVLFKLYSFPNPTIVLAQGLVLGGGLGLLAAADIAIATKDAVFQLPEVKIGVTPSIVSPYVISCIGERCARFYFLTGIRFDADCAKRMGLIHQMADVESLMPSGMIIAQTLLQNSKSALQRAKALIVRVDSEKITNELSNEMAEHLANIRSTKEAQERLRAFIEKRKPK